MRYTVSVIVEGAADGESTVVAVEGVTYYTDNGTPAEPVEPYPPCETCGLRDIHAEDCRYGVEEWPPPTSKGY